MRIIIIGGGASGFFAAITAAEANPKNEVVILEKTSKLLSKVKVSGGGRCNVTHHCPNPNELSKYYPRGQKELKKAFQKFAVNDIMQWFEKRKVALKVEEDNRVFPVTDDSQTIIDCFLKEAKRLGILIETGTEVQEVITKDNQTFQLDCANNKTFYCDRLIITAGGYAKEESFNWIKKLGHLIVKPVPSLFTFNLPKHPITALMGLSMPNVKIKIEKTKLMTEGPLLVTHWGLSAYSVLRASSWGARLLNEMDYDFIIHIAWLPQYAEDESREEMKKLQLELAKRQIENKNPFQIPNRLWSYFLEKTAIPPAKIWSELSKKEMNQLINLLLNDVYEVKGKTTFKEEFVTSGGVDLKEINFDTMQSLKCPNLYFAGEILDLDGLTGGFNFQAAWTTGFIAGNAAGL